MFLCQFIIYYLPILLILAIVLVIYRLQLTIILGSIDTTLLYPYLNNRFSIYYYNNLFIIVYSILNTYYGMRNYGSSYQVQQVIGGYRYQVQEGKLVPTLGNKDTKDTRDASSYISYSDLSYIYIGASRQLKGIFIYQLNYNLGVTFRI